MNVLLRPIRTSVGSKFVVALTGLILTTFVVAHLAGNLLIFAVPDALNSYAEHLKENPLLLWGARGGLLLVFVVHLVLTIRLSLANRAARPVGYYKENTLQASWASRHMLLTGLVLF